MFKFLQSAPQASPAPIIPDSLLDPQCAWCIGEQEQAAGQQPSAESRNGSHGICDGHAAMVWQTWQEEKARRQQH